MCKTLCLVYNCDHAVDVTISACLGTFATEYPQRSYQRIHCRSHPHLDINIDTRCGACFQRDVEQQCDQARSTALADVRAAQKKLDEGDWRDIESDNEQLEEARQKLADVEHENRKLLRAARQASPTKSTPGSGTRYRLSLGDQRGSLLRRDVKPEDVVEADRLRPSRFARPRFQLV